MPVAGYEKHLIPVLLATSPYRGGSFFDYLDWSFFAVVVGSDGQWVAELDNARRRY